jgi:hypothetical protein
MSGNEYPKSYGVNTYPVLSSETSGLLKRIEPMLTPELLVSRYLKNVPGIDKYTSDELKDKINLAANNVELDLNTTITPEVRREKHPFDRSLYKSFIHIMSNFGPIVQVNRLSIRSSNDVNIFEIPASWIESARFFQKQINVIPLTVVGATGVTSGQPTGAAGLAFIAAMQGGIDWVPSYWEIEYVTGLCNKEGYVPIPVNELIGINAAIAVLSNLASLNVNTSVSVSHDGISQSSSNPGPGVYKVRIEELTLKKEELTKKLKKTFANKFFVSNI